MAKNNILIRSKLRKADEFLRQNNLPEATKLYEKACQLDGGNPELWTRLGILKRQTGDYTQAEYCGRKAIRFSPTSPLAHHSLAAALHSQGRVDEAIAYYRKAIQLQPDLVEAHYFLANALREKGKLDEAVNAYKHLLQLAPDHFEGLNNFGALLTNLERSEEAAKILSRAVELNPASVETLTNFARAHTLIGSQTIAIEVLQKALKLRPKFLDAHLELAWAFRLNGQNSEALRQFNSALELSPGNRRALIGKAKIYEILGRTDDAYVILKPLLEGDNISDALPLFFEISRGIGQRDRAVSMIQETLARGDINVAGTAPLHFRLGKHFDREKMYDAAFEHFNTANRLSRRHFNLDKTADQFDRIRQIYDNRFIKNLPCSNARSDLLIFIVGMPRSGTSLVEQIVASHPEIYGAGETDNLMQLADRLSVYHATDKFPDFIPKLSQNTLNREAEELEKTFSTLSPTAKRITDKMPHNFVYVGLMLQLFPGCHIIHCRRNPLDTCLSCYISEFGSNYHNYAYNLDTLGRYYGLYSKLMNHWTTRFPDRILEVNYEALVENQETVSRSMLEHCDMEWNDQCLDFHKLDRVINTISYNQVRQPLYRRSVNRWLNYDRHLGPLRNALGQSGVEF